jgi:hypothetical protein
MREGQKIYFRGEGDQQVSMMNFKALTYWIAVPRSGFGPRHG